MLARVTHLLPLTNIRRQRILPLNGRVLVRSGQKVSATDVVADARLAKDHLLLDVSKGLGVPVAQADKLVGRKVGDEVAQGDVIAGPVGILQHTVRSPRDGRIVAVGGGQVLLELENSTLELRAGMAGVVSELIPDRGVVIENQGALLQGVWGNNLIEDGLLTVLARSPEDELTIDRLDVSQRGAIIVGGPCMQPDVLRMAAQIPLRALVLASLSDKLLPLAGSCAIPILVLEGFGRLPMSTIAYKILSTNEKREMSVNAAAWDHNTGERPEVVIPLPSSGQIPTPHESDIYVAGKTVKIIQAPRKGQIATVIAVNPGLVTFPSGIRASAAVLRLEGGEQVTEPLANLDVIS
jgi:hypothetical protein